MTKFVCVTKVTFIPTWERNLKFAKTRYEDFDIDSHLSALISTTSDTFISGENALHKVASHESGG